MLQLQAIRLADQGCHRSIRFNGVLQKIAQKFPGPGVRPSGRPSDGRPTAIGPLSDRRPPKNFHRKKNPPKKFRRTKFELKNCVRGGRVVVPRDQQKKKKENDFFRREKYLMPRKTFCIAAKKILCRETKIVSPRKIFPKCPNVYLLIFISIVWTH